MKLLIFAILLSPQVFAFNLFNAKNYENVMHIKAKYKINPTVHSISASATSGYFHSISSYANGSYGDANNKAGLILKNKCDLLSGYIDVNSYNPSYSWYIHCVPQRTCWHSAAIHRVQMTADCITISQPE